MAELMEYVKVLADQIGPRPVSTEEEHQSSLYVAQELTDEGLEVDVDEFATPTGVRWPFAIAFLAITLGTLITGVGIFVPGIATTMFIIGILLVLVGVFIYYAEHNNKPLLSKMRSGGVSQNVVARYVPSSVARESRRRKVVIVAHVDTVRAQPEVMPNLVQKTPLMRKVIFYDALAVLAIAIVRFLPLPWPEVVDLVLWIVSLLGCLYLLAAAACIVANKFMPYIAGGNDNASSVAVLLATAKRLLDPEEREKYAVERPVAVETDNPVETLVPSATGSFAPVADEAQPTVHDEAAAQAAGVVPEGAELEYAVEQPAAGAAAATQVMQPVGQEGAPAAQGVPAAAEAQPIATVPEDGEVPAGGYWPEPTEEVAQEPAQPAPQPVAVPKAKEKPKAAALPSWYKAAKEKAAKDLAEKEAEAPARDERGARGSRETPVQPAYYRSRFADMPLRGPVHHGDEEQPEEKPAAEKETAASAPAATPAPAPQAQPAAEPARRPAVRVSASEEDALPQVTIAKHEPATAASESPALEPAESAALSGLLDVNFNEAPRTREHEVVSFEIPDDELEELTPDLSGMFSPVKEGAEGAAAEQVETAEPKKRAGILGGLTSRIPSIGASNEASRQERAAVAETPLEAADVPEVVETVEQDAAEAADETVVFDAADVADAAEATQVMKPAAAAKPKVEHRKPKARRVSDDFQPTKAPGSRTNEVLDTMRQAAPVSSTYEDTPQAFDPFAPREEREARPAASPSISTSFPALSGQMPAVGGDLGVSPGATSSFPSLTGSFPSLSGTMPAISANDFGEEDFGFEPSAADVADDFGAAGMTSQIDIPESRFHNAMDKVGGLFNRKKKRKGRGGDRNDAGDAEHWNEDDDFGWKGGAFLDESESAFAAAKARAAEIRDSVVSMTESDLLDKEVWFVALGASGAGEQGMKNFLELHGSELRGALIVNLECVGAGDIRYVDMEGCGKPFRSDRRLQNLARNAARDITGHEMKSQKLDWRNTDATPALAEGLRAMSIMGFDGVAPACWHWKTDTSDIVDPDNLEYVTKLLLKIIEEA